VTIIGAIHRLVRCRLSSDELLDRLHDSFKTSDALLDKLKKELR